MSAASEWYGPGPEEVVVTLWKFSPTSSIWAYSTKNRVGGSFGSNQRGPQRAAWTLACKWMPEGTEYRLVVNGQDRGLRVRGAGEPKDDAAVTR